ncbi:hypothetical protein VOM14_18710 [Paraburkholderia sp. MPAMCS5]|uniref:hypothetical protein n=1 Tax=Paraburkholderia sp. MPAMCS5 TaxID=3112563 RepID=UPI002E177CB4|nr:hypothetical protein [Paraburkholderia sp. MPAMCS5]
MMPSILLVKTATNAWENTRAQTDLSCPASMSNQLLITEMTPDGWSWTLATRCSDILHKLELEYGPRDRAYTFVGVDFHGERPHIWYPGNRQHVAIRLSMSALDDIPRAFYQLAHECVHLLSPSVEHHASVLEEGLATLFAETYALRAYNQHFSPSINGYARAASDVRELLGFHPDAISALRRVEPAFYKMDAGTFAQAGLVRAPIELRERLLTRFID